MNDILVLRGTPSPEEVAALTLALLTVTAPSAGDPRSRDLCPCRTAEVT